MLRGIRVDDLGGASDVVMNSITFRGDPKVTVEIPLRYASSNGTTPLDVKFHPNIRSINFLFEGKQLLRELGTDE